MKTVAVFEAKSRLSEILADVIHGEEYTITRHGTPIARLIADNALSQQSAARGRTSAVIARILASRSPLEGLNLRQAIEEGRD